MGLGNDLENRFSISNSIDPAAHTVSVNGAGVDCLTLENEITGVFNVGDVTGTSPTMDPKLEESEDNTTFTAFGVAATGTQATESDQARLVSGIRSKRYVRAVATIGGTNPSFELSAAIIGQKKSY